MYASTEKTLLDAMCSISPPGLPRVLFVSLLLTVGMSLIGCDQAGDNQEEEETDDPVEERLNDLNDTGRLLANNSGYFADYNDSFALYFEPFRSDSEDGTIVHSCTDEDGDGTIDTYTREKNVIQDAKLNASGNLVTTREVTKAEGQNYSSEGQSETIEYLGIDAENGSSTFEVIETPEDYKGIIDVTESTDGVPESVSECKNLDQFKTEGNSSRPVGTWRFLINSEGYDAREDESFALFYDFSSEGDVVLHSCIDQSGDGSAGTHVREETSVDDTFQNQVGNTVINETIADGNGVIYDESNEGGSTTVEHLSTTDNIAWWWVRSSDQNDIEGNIDVAEKTSGVPTSDQECQNRDQFIQ